MQPERGPGGLDLKFASLSVVRRSELQIVSPRLTVHACKLETANGSTHRVS